MKDNFHSHFHLHIPASSTLIRILVLLAASSFCSINNYFVFVDESSKKLFSRYGNYCWDCYSENLIKISIFIAPRSVDEIIITGNEDRDLSRGIRQ